MQQVEKQTLCAWLCSSRVGLLKAESVIDAKLRLRDVAGHGGRLCSDNGRRFCWRFLRGGHSLSRNRDAVFIATATRNFQLFRTVTKGTRFVGTIDALLGVFAHHRMLQLWGHSSPLLVVKLQFHLSQRLPDRGFGRRDVCHRARPNGDLEGGTQPFRSHQLDL